MSGFIIITFILSLFCVGHSFTITGTKDAEYDGIDNYYEPADIESSGTKCYFKAALKGCKKGKILNTIFADAKESEKPFTTTVTSTSAACLEATCTRSSRNLILSRSIEIGGDGENSKPDTLNKGHSNGFYNNRAECMRSGSDVVNIKCKSTNSNIDRKTGKKKIEMEEYDPEIPDIEGQSDDDDVKAMQADMSQADSVLPIPDDGNNDQLAKILEDSSNNDNDNDDNEEEEKEEKEEKVTAIMTDEIGNGTTANIQWNNWYRRAFYVRAPNRCGLARIRSYHNNYYEDRVFQFYHRCPSYYYFNRCYWTGYRNYYDGVLYARCASNYMINGIYSTYSYRHRDRRFSFLCCRGPRYYTTRCRWSWFINYWDGYMNYGVGARRVFTGMYSYHSNRREDRRWRVHSCYVQRY